MEFITNQDIATSIGIFETEHMQQNHALYKSVSLKYNRSENTVHEYLVDDVKHCILLMSDNRINMYAFYTDNTDPMIYDTGVIKVSKHEFNQLFNILVTRSHK